ncbi:MAG: M20/M25/M40 family metallo-hydrolase [Actinomycetota bacterium]|nr:M20/M25/M40 family metallo-hydrolase [Actinomycetota bacterium]
MNTTPTRHRRVGIALTSAMAIFAAMFTMAPAANATPTTESQGLRKAVTLAGIRAHQAALDAIGAANGGNRVAGSPGYIASADYVESTLEASGYTVTRFPFQFTFNADATPAVFQQVSPTQATYVDGVDFSSMTYSGNGDVTAPVWAVALQVPPPAAAGTTTSGCQAADFAGFPAGHIALIQRGTCTFRVKADNALAAGASAVIVMNEGQPGRTAAVGGTLGEPTTTLPVIGTTFDIGVDLSNGVATGDTGSTARVRVDRVNEQRTTENLLAETAGGDPNNVIVVGAHLDSVSRGPGINDNGSGSAGILEIAEQFAARGIQPRNKIRFAWWGAEELGLIGSTRYVDSLSQEQKDQIALNLNFDMVGSPNFVRFVYDGDNSAYPVGPGSADGPQGSGEIERVFHDYFGSVGLASSETPFSGRSDYGPFIAQGIPAGGLFTGAEGVKTAAEAAIYGGTAGQAYDPCYHLACDTYANNSDAGLHQMVDAAAHATLYFAKRNFARQPLVDPAGPVSGVSATTGGGGLHDDDHEPVPA